MRNINIIIPEVNSRLCKATYKYGIEVPTFIEHIKQIGENNGNWYWQDSIDNEMKNVSVAFEIIDHGEPNPVGWAQSSGYLIFDVKTSES